MYQDSWEHVAHMAHTLKSKGFLIFIFIDSPKRGKKRKKKANLDNNKLLDMLKRPLPMGWPV